MGKTIDFTGQRFGQLIALRRSPETAQRWLFRCDCGNEKTINHKMVRYGGTTSCGCKRWKRTVDLTGQKFGAWTALSRIDNEKWVFRCDCGSVKAINYQNVVRGASKSCGCTRKESARATFFKDLTGQRFGKLKVQSFEGYVDIGKCKPNYRPSFLCSCECGNTKIALGVSLSDGSVNSCGCLLQGMDSISGYLQNTFRDPEAEAAFYVFGMANFPGLSKPGIAKDISTRVSYGEGEYGKLHDFIALPRFEAWLIEQAVLLETRSHHDCPAELSDWQGHSELRRLAPAALFEMACGYHEQLQELGREEFAIRYLPTTPKQREQLEAMKPQLVAA